ncbi:unnamed protein product [Camellia sinensis]
MRKSFKDSLKALEADIYYTARQYPAYEDGKTTMCFYERKASIREFYGVIFPPLLQLQIGITDVEDRKQREICAAKYKRRDEMNKGKVSEIDIEREEECGICLEISSKVVLPKCNHSMCMKCYRNWHTRSQSCPFCQDSLKRVNSGDLWIYTSGCDIVDLSSIAKEYLKRLIMYIDKLPLIVPDPMLISYDPHFRLDETYLRLQEMETFVCMDGSFMLYLWLHMELFPAKNQIENTGLMIHNAIHPFTPQSEQAKLVGLRIKRERDTMAKTKLYKAEESSEEVKPETTIEEDEEEEENIHVKKIETFSEHPDKIAPLVGYFPSGFDPLKEESSTQEQPKVRVFRHENRTKRLQLVVSPNGSQVNFVGTNTAPQLCNYALGVLDKESQTLKIVPIASNKIFRLEPIVAGSDSYEKEPSKEELRAEERADKIRELKRMYSTAKSVKQDKKRQPSVQFFPLASPSTSITGKALCSGGLGLHGFPLLSTSFTDLQSAR